MARAALVVLALLAGSTPSKRAGGERPIVPFAVGTGPVTSDGVRYAAWVTGPHTVTVVDDALGRTRTVRVPDDCTIGFGEIVVGAGALWARCGVANPDALVDLRTGAVRRLPLLRVVGTPYIQLAIGRRWLRVLAEARIRTVLVNRSTLAVRRPRLDRRHALDLDARSGLQPICHRLRAPRPAQRLATAFTYDPRLGLFVLPPAGGLVLHPCAGGRARTLSTGHVSRRPQSVDGIATWSGLGGVTALVHRRLVRYSLAQMPPVVHSVVHTRTHLYASGSGLSGGEQIGRAPLP